MEQGQAVDSRKIQEWIGELYLNNKILGERLMQYESRKQEDSGSEGIADDTGKGDPEPEIEEETVNSQAV